MMKAYVSCHDSDDCRVVEFGVEWGVIEVVSGSSKCGGDCR